MNVYSHLNYKDFLRLALIEKRKHVNASFTYSRMAKVCGIQKTYLSRVLNSDASHLSEDQLFQAGTYLGLTKDENKYLQLLRTYQKSDVLSFKAELKADIESIRALHERSESHLAVETIESSVDLSSYYLDPNVMITHIFLAVERFRKDLKALALQLHFSDEYLSQILSKLEQMKLIKLTDGIYVLLKEDTHLPIDSPLYNPYRFMQRVKTLERIQRLSQEKTYNFSVVFSADEATRKKIKGKFLELLEFAGKAANGAKNEEVYQMNFDLFDWSM